MSDEQPEQPWISVKAGSQRLTLSGALATEIGAEDGDKIVLAFTREDDEYLPWIGVVKADEAPGAPAVQIQEGKDSPPPQVESSSMAGELEHYSKGDTRVRLLLSGETQSIDHPDTQGMVTVHRLTPPEGSHFPS